MELRQLRYFVRIVELGSLTRAAKDLYIAQPALSAQISKLENELDIKLLTRSVRGVMPTEAGESLYLHAQAVLRQIERLRLDVGNTSVKPAGPVSIGVPTSAANVVAGPLIAAVHENYPDIQLRIVESLSGHLKELVSNGRLEMSLLFELPEALRQRKASEITQTNHLTWSPLLEEQLFLLSKRTDPVEQKSTVNLAQVAKLRLVLPGQANLTRQLIDSTFEAKGLKLNVVAEIDSLATIQSILESGHAATILSLSSMVGVDAFSRISAQSLEGGRFNRRLSLCTSEILGLGTAAKSVAALIPKLIDSLIESGKWKGASRIERVSIEPS